MMYERKDLHVSEQKRLPYITYLAKKWLCSTDGIFSKIIKKNNLKVICMSPFCVKTIYEFK